MADSRFVYTADGIYDRAQKKIVSQREFNQILEQIQPKNRCC